MKRMLGRFMLPVLIYTALLIVFPSTAISGMSEGLKLCINSLVPSLFPFFVCSNLLVNLGFADVLAKILNPLIKPLFGLSGRTSLALILGCISGYPVGAKTAVDLYASGFCSKSEAEKILAYCNNSGPMFVIGALGAEMLGNVSAGRIIYISHFLSSLTVAIIMRNIKTSCLHTKSSSARPEADFPSLFTDTISSSVLTMLTICGFVVIFSVLISFIESLGVINALSSLGLDYNLCKTFIYGFLECSGGCKTAITATDNPLLTYMLLSSVLSWSGLSVHLQVLGIIKKAKLSSNLYFKGKVLMTIISPIITFILFGFYTGRVNPVSLLYLIIIFGVILFVCIRLYSVTKKIFYKYLALPPR